jgi:hypothetical protein
MGEAVQRASRARGRTRGGWFAAVALAALGSGAQSSEPPPTEPPAVSAPQDVEGELAREQHRTRQSFGVARARFSYPLIASTGFGLLLAQRSQEIDCVTQCEMTAWYGSAEAGVGGAALSFGPAFMIAELGDNDFFLSRRYMGYALRGSVIRTWGGYTGRPEHEWLGGVEGEFTIVSLNLTLGVYHRFSGRDEGTPWLVGGGVGWGF